MGASATTGSMDGGLFDASTGATTAGAPSGAATTGVVSRELSPIPSSSGIKSGAVRIAPQVGQPTALKNTW
ncbi:hypothetical protein MYSE111917_27105 [Mycobacterium senriense]